MACQIQMWKQPVLKTGAHLQAPLAFSIWLALSWSRILQLPNFKLIVFYYLPYQAWILWSFPALNPSTHSLWLSLWKRFHLEPRQHSNEIPCITLHVWYGTSACLAPILFETMCQADLFRVSPVQVEVMDQELRALVIDTADSSCPSISGNESELSFRAVSTLNCSLIAPACSLCFSYTENIFSCHVFKASLPPNTLRSSHLLLHLNPHPLCFF